MKSLVKMASLMTLAGLAVPTAGRADVTWEHAGKLTVGLKKPETLLTFSAKNQWKGQKHRSTFYVDATPVAALAALPLEEMTKQKVPAKVQADFVTRLDDDRVLAWSPQLKQYMDEPLRSLPKKLRINIWEGLDPQLGKEEVPQLTPEQRSRLGREIRATYSPFIKRYSRFYFRQLPNIRTINGTNARGFRLTAMMGDGSEWAKLSAEWWLAEGMAGDNEVRDYVKQITEIQKLSGGPTVSMWANETPYVLLAMLPEEFHQAWATFAGTPTAPNYGFQGAPLQLYVTVTPPPLQRMESGDIRLSLELKKSSTDDVDAKAFEAPADYKRVPLDPYIKMAENYLKMQQKEMQKMLDSM